MAENASVRITPRALLTAQETINWIAFREIADRDLTGRAEIAAKWSVEPLFKVEPFFSGDSHVLRWPLQVLSGRYVLRGTPDGWPKGDPDYDRVERWAKIIIERRGCSAAELLIELDAELAQHAPRRRRYLEAERELVEALTGGLLTTLACPPAPDPGAQVPDKFRYKPGGPAVEVPARVWATPDIGIHPSGRLTRRLDGYKHQGSWHGPEYVDARFRTAEVLKVWSPEHDAGEVKTDAGHAIQDATVPSPVYHTGTAGRPTSVQIVRQEMARRAAEGEFLSTLAAECRALKAWLSETHPEAPLIGLSAMENGLRADHRRHKKAMNHP